MNLLLPVAQRARGGEVVRRAGCWPTGETAERPFPGQWPAATRLSGRTLGLVGELGQQCADLGLAEPAVTARSPDGTDPPSGCPARHGLRVDPEQSCDLPGGEELLLAVLAGLLGRCGHRTSSFRRWLFGHSGRILTLTWSGTRTFGFR